MITDFKSNGGTNGALESGAPAVPNAIEVKHIVKKYGEFTAVDDVSFSVKEEEIFGLLGPNGAGKSTLIRMMTTLIPITAGTARVAGHDVQKEADAARRAIGVIPQALTSDLDLTVEENLNIYAKLYDVPAKKRKAAIDELLEVVDLTKWRHAQTKTLSGGMRRRLEIARGLVHSPRRRSFEHRPANRHHRRFGRYLGASRHSRDPGRSHWPRRYAAHPSPRRDGNLGQSVLQIGRGRFRYAARREPPQTGYQDYRAKNPFG